MKTFNKRKLWYVIGIVFIILVSAIVISFTVCNGKSKDIPSEIPNSDIYPTNSDGQTYGFAETTAFDQIPDLITAMGKNGTLAYMRKEDYLGQNRENYEVYTVLLTGDELEFAREQYKDQYPDVTKISFYKECFDIPLFDESGKKEVDKFVMERGIYPYPEDNSNDSERNENDSLYQTNSNGQTYGYAETTSYEQIPDLIPAMGKNHIDGYMRKEDLLGEHLDEYDAYTVELTDDELEVAREQYSNQYDDVTTVDFYKKCVDVPLYDVSGEKEVDKFTITIGYYPYPKND